MINSWHLVPVLLLTAHAGCFANGQIASDGSNPAGASDGVWPSVEACGDASTGLPPDITAVLQQRCQSCHDSTLADDAPMSMTTYGELLAPAPSDASQTVAQVSLARMSAETDPMPPGEGASVPADELAAWQAWLDAGTPRAADIACSSGSSSSSESIDTPVVCTSDTTWKSRKDNADMNPGRACIACHQQQERSAIVSVGGTVYATAHEPDLCYGAGTSGAKVVVTGNDGTVLTMRVGPTGNFSQRSRTKLSFPIRAKVVASDGSEREMVATQTTGDCNGCHTEAGAEGAPGRIFLP